MERLMPNRRVPTLELMPVCGNVSTDCDRSGSQVRNLRLVKHGQSAERWLRRDSIASFVILPWQEKCSQWGSDDGDTLAYLRIANRWETDTQYYD